MFSYITTKSREQSGDVVKPWPCYRTNNGWRRWVSPSTTTRPLFSFNRTVQIEWNINPFRRSSRCSYKSNWIDAPKFTLLKRPPSSIRPNIYNVSSLAKTDTTLISPWWNNPLRMSYVSTVLKKISRWSDFFRHRSLYISNIIPP